MTAPYRLYGADLSPYSIKVRNYLRYKGLAHEWLQRSGARQAEFARYAKLPLIPVLVGADDFVLQDSTPMLRTLEERHPEPSITPPEPALAFVSALLEDYADEWLNKAMFHFRWTNPADQESAAARIVAMMLEGQEGVDHAPIVAQVRERMTGRLHMVGSSAETGPVIESSMQASARLIEAHLEGRPYLFGGRPALADFSVAAQFGQLLSDPTPGAWLRAHAPRLTAWVARMDVAQAEGPFEGLETLAPTLKPLLIEEIAGVYLPWMKANADAFRGETEVSVELLGRLFTQAPQRYASKAFLDIRRRRLEASDEALAALLAETGCEALLYLPPRPGDRDEAGGANREAEGGEEDGADESGDDGAPEAEEAAGATPEE